MAQKDGDDPQTFMPKGWSASGNWVDFTNKCQSCGYYIPLPTDMNFCPGCGQPISKPTQEMATPGTIACPQCHKENLPGNGFCVHCGINLNVGKL